MITQLPHQAAAGVQGKRLRAVLELHPSFLGQAIPFAVVASAAAGDEVLPGALAATGTRHDVVKGEVHRRISAPAILTRMAVADENVLA